jgi:peroxiredoxin Q/BCP
MYGKISIGVIRSTFLLDSDGKVLKEWRNVKATGHVEKVLREIN